MRLPAIINKAYHLFKRGIGQLHLFYLSSSIYPVLSSKGNKKPVTIFFIPEAGVIPHATLTAFLARTVQELGHSVILVRCFALFKRCPVFGMKKVGTGINDEIIENICYNQCYKFSDSLAEFYNLDYIILNQFITHKEISKLDNILDNAPLDLRLFEFEGIYFGLLTMKEMVLETKISDFNNIKIEERLLWLNLIQTSIVGYLVAGKLFKKYNVSSISCFNLYASSIGMSEAAKVVGIPLYVICNGFHRNADFRRIWIAPEVSMYTNTDPVIAWPEWKELPLNGKIFNEIIMDLSGHFNAHGAVRYSPPKTGFMNNSFLNEIKNKYKKIVVAYSSSTDETLATKYLLDAKSVKDERDNISFAFYSQIHWLQETINYFSKHKDYCFIVRVHPRVGKNRVNKEISHHYFELRNAFASLPDNCFFIWPEEEISSFDLADLADLALISWSSIGLDLARMGIPVISYTNEIPTFPDDNSVIYIAKNEIDYFSEIEKYLNEKQVNYTKTMERVRYAFRWYHLQRLAVCVDFSDVIPENDFKAFPIFSLSNSAGIAESVICRNENMLKLQLIRYKNTINGETYRQESADLRIHLDNLNYLKRF